VLYVNTAAGLAAVDTGSGKIRFTTGSSLPSADWAVLFASQPSPNGNRVVTVDARTGTERASVEVVNNAQTSGDGNTPLVVAAVSPSGRRVALAPGAPSGAGESSVAGRTQTTIVVADPRSGTATSRAYDLPGNFEPDAFSTDDQRLFVLEYLPPQAPQSYRVRVMDLATGKVEGVWSRDKQPPVAEEQMRGTRRMHALSPDRKVLYTLYTHQPDHLHGRDLAAGLTQSRANVHAFVHVLNLEQGWAYCVDLPDPFGLGPVAAHALALSRNGSILYVSDRSSGMVATVYTNSLEVKRTSDLGRDPLAARGAAGAAIGPNGHLYLSSRGEVAVVEPMDMKVVQRWPVAGVTGGLALSPDGQRLYLGLDRQLAILNTTTGQLIKTIAVPELLGIERVS
jgi:hypothetical protein